MNEPNILKTPEQKLNELNKNPLNKDVKVQDLVNFLEVVSVAPTGVPKKFLDSIKLYSNGGTYRIYFYLQGVGWHYNALT